MSIRHWRPLAVGVVLFAALLTVLAALSTSRATVSATTGNESNLFTSGQIDVQANSRQDFLLSHDGLYPGLVLESCLDVSYQGTIDGVDVRFFTELTADGGLADLMEVAIWTGTGATEASCDDFEADGDPRFKGSLQQLSADHPDFESGIELLADARGGEHVALRVRATILDTEQADDAQGLTADFLAVLEGRM
ncbi:MAG: hypothetical protein ACR2QE_04180 [Acidimicrobiales bacterium]